MNNFNPLNSSFTDFSLIKLPPETELFLYFYRRTPEVALGHNTGYSYVHAHIAQIKNERELCFHVTDHLVGELQPRMQWNISIEINACTHVDFA